MSRSPGVMHTDKVLDVLAGGGTPSDLSASWRRSGHLHALDPASRLPSHRLGHAEIAAAQQRLGEFLKVAQRTLDRQTSLLKDKATSQREVDAARNDFAAAESDLATAQGTLAAARKTASG